MLPFVWCYARVRCLIREISLTHARSPPQLRLKQAKKKQKKKKSSHK